MSTFAMNFDLYALAKPKSIDDIIALGYELLDELDQIEAHIDAAIARCEAMADA
jgi:hypothetical protein